MEASHGCVGAKWVDYYLTRGQYDFCVIAKADSFSAVVAMPLKSRASGLLKIWLRWKRLISKKHKTSHTVQGIPLPSGLAMTNVFNFV